MQPVGTDDEVKSAWWRVAEDHFDATSILCKSHYGVVEEVFHLVIESAVKQVDEVAAKDLDLRNEPLPVEVVGANCRPSAALLVDPGDAGLVEADAAGIIEHAHTFDDGTPRAAQVHCLSARTRGRRYLNDGNRETVAA